MTTWIVLAWVNIIVTAMGAITLRRRATWLRLVLSLVSMALMTGLLVPLVGSPVKPVYAPGVGAFGTLSEQTFVAAWWLLIARVVIYASQVALGINHQRHAARLLLDLAAGAIYAGALFATIDVVFGVSIAGLLATSGIIAIVLGLALQSTLSDLFSGVAIGIDRPFGVGDRVLIEGVAEGRIIETNWRSTRVATSTNDVATIPNSVVAKARIVNQSAPSEDRLATVKIILDAGIQPSDAIAMLRASALNSTLIAQGAASVACTDLIGGAAFYEIQFSVALSEQLQARSDLLDRVVCHARYNGMALVPADGTSSKHVVAPDLPHLLRDNPVLATLDEGERDGLATCLLRHEGDAGQKLFTQGETVPSLFVIAKGTFEVSRDIGNGSRRIGTIGPGDYFGELALLTGSPNAATIASLTAFVAYEVTKDMFAPLLHANPDVLHALERAASTARAVLDRSIAAQATVEPTNALRLLDRIRAFFEVTTPHATPTEPET